MTTVVQVAFSHTHSHRTPPLVRQSIIQSQIASLHSRREEANKRFYRAMHFSAKRGIAIACRLSVCLSVCNVGEL